WPQVTPKHLAFRRFSIARVLRNFWRWMIRGAQRQSFFRTLSALLSFPFHKARSTSTRLRIGKISRRFRVQPKAAGTATATTSRPAAKEFFERLKEFVR